MPAFIEYTPAAPRRTVRVKRLLAFNPGNGQPNLNRMISKEEVKALRQYIRRLYDNGVLEMKSPYKVTTNGYNQLVDITDATGKSFLPEFIEVITGPDETVFQGD